MKINFGRSVFETIKNNKDLCREKRGEYLLKLNVEGFAFSEDLQINTKSYEDLIDIDPDKIVIIGIGGSSLGTKMIYNAFRQYCKKEILFVETTEPEIFQEVMDNIDMKKTVFISISKSGSTMETAAATLFFIEQTRSALQNDWKDHFVFITDPETGDLRKFVKENSLISLEIPSELGGRYSVLSNVGMYPLYLAGFPVNECIAGAKDHLENIKKGILTEPFDLALCNYHFYEKGHNILALFPYIYKLKTFGEWFIQLWAESLGKIDRSGKNVGQTPMIAVGPTDQHSIIQLFTEGPKDKVIIFLRQENRNVNFSIEEKIELSSFKYLYKKDFKLLADVELKGTLQNLEDLNVPVFEVVIDKLSPGIIGELIMFSYIITTFTAMLMGVDPFDQPGVEGGKKIMYKALGKE